MVVSTGLCDLSAFQSQMNVPVYTKVFVNVTRIFQVINFKNNNSRKFWKTSQGLFQSQDPNVAAAVGLQMSYNLFKIKWILDCLAKKGIGMFMCCQFNN